MNTSHKEFSRLLVTHYAEYKKSLSLTSPKINCQNFISRAIFTGKHGKVRIFFGASEWHIEFDVESHGTVWSFADIINVFPCVGDWIAKNKASVKHDLINSNKLKCEIILFYRLLTEKISLINEFLWIGNNEASCVVQSGGIGMNHECAVAKLKKQREIEAKTWHEKIEKEPLRSKLGKAWLEKDYHAILACAESLKEIKLLKSEIAKINYARKITKSRLNSRRQNQDQTLK